MYLQRRFIFRGNSAALSGQLFRPGTVIVETDGASSLGLSGGRSRSELKGRSFGDIIKYDSATTFAEGLFDDPRHAAAVTDHEGYQDELMTTTTVWSEVRGLSVGVKPVFTAKRIKGSLVSRTPLPGAEPPIAPTRETTIQGAAISGFGLQVLFNVAVFQEFNTHAKLVAATHDAKQARALERHLLLRTAVEGQPPPRTPRLLGSGPTIYATIVREIRWVDKPYPGAKIDGHTVIVPDYGTIYFGELLITGHERRLAMVRFELGSPIGGYADCAVADSNGSWFP
jgi:hypothetical protein